jgi:hypothetical protein
MHSHENGQLGLLEQARSIIELVIQLDALIDHLRPFHITAGRLHLRPAAGIAQDKGTAVFGGAGGPGVAQVVRAEFPDAQDVPPQDFDPHPHRPHRHHLVGQLLVLAAAAQQFALRSQIRLVRFERLEQIGRQFHTVGRVRFLAVDGHVTLKGSQDCFQIAL